METFEMDDFQMRLPPSRRRGTTAADTAPPGPGEDRKGNTLTSSAPWEAFQGRTEGSETCGALLGGACLLGFYAGKGAAGREGTSPGSVTCSRISRSGSGRRRAFPGEAPDARTFWKPSERHGAPCLSGRCG